MKDINFFSIYSDKNSLGYKRKQLVKLGILILFIIGLIYAGLTIWLISTQTHIESVNAKLMSPEMQKYISEYNVEKRKLNAITDYNNAANGLIDNMDKLNNIKVETLETISKTLPASTRFDTLDISNNRCSFVFVVASPQLAAQTMVRLEETEIFDSIVLENISIDDNNTYYCYISALLKVGEK